MRAGSTVLHHIFILNCDFPEGSTFQRANPTTYSHVTPPVTCSPAGSTTQLIHETSIPWHWEWPQCAQVPFFPDSCQVIWLSQLLLLPWVSLGEHGNRPKTTLQPSTGLFKESKSSGSLLDYPYQKPLKVCPKAHLHLWLLLTTWQLCCICQGCNTQPW